VVAVNAGRPRSRVRTQWLALGAALVVLSGVLVAWALSRASDRVDVVRMARRVPAGQTLTEADLTVTPVAIDSGVSGLVPAASLDELVGRVAAVELRPGALVQVGMWRDAVQLSQGESSVGAVLKAGRYPAGLGRGDVALAAAIDGSSTPVTLRVLDTRTGEGGSLTVTLAVPAANAVAVAQLAATDRLVLVGTGSDGGA
jgi:hypothetical protein